MAPVSVAIMTPFPLLFLYIYKKLWERYGTRVCFLLLCACFLLDFCLTRIVQKHKKLETEIPTIEVDNNFNRDTPKVVSTISS